jgi:hypothetical protein
MPSTETLMTALEKSIKANNILLHLLLDVPLDEKKKSLFDDAAQLIDQTAQTMFPKQEIPKA